MRSRRSQRLPLPNFVMELGEGELGVSLDRKRSIRRGTCMVRLMERDYWLLVSEWVKMDRADEKVFWLRSLS